jgi:hypothetical protein
VTCAEVIAAAHRDGLDVSVLVHGHKVSPLIQDLGVASLDVVAHVVVVVPADHRASLQVMKGQQSMSLLRMYHVP